MGSTSVSGICRGISPEAALKKIRAEAKREYGDNPYNGTVSTIDSWNPITVSNIAKLMENKKEISAFIDSKLDKLQKHEGEIICVKEVGYRIFKPETATTDKPLPFDPAYYLRMLKAPNTAYLIEVDIATKKVINTVAGTKDALKKRALSWLYYSSYTSKCYIITKRGLPICVKGSSTELKTTTKKSDMAKGIKVCPVYEYLYYGWAAE